MPSRLRAAVVLSLLLAGMGCSSGPADELQQLVPELPKIWVDHLRDPNEERFREFADEQGTDYLSAVDNYLRVPLQTRSIDEYRQAAPVVIPALSRVRMVLAETRGFERRWALHQRYLALPEELAHRHQVLLLEAREIGRPADSGNEEPSPAGLRSDYKRLLAVVEELDELDAPVVRTYHYYLLSEYASALDEVELRRHWLHEVLEHEADLGNFRISCQALGVLGSMAGDDGDDTGKLEYWYQGLTLARTHGLAMQTNRLLVFLAGHYERSGRLALARDLRQQGQELWEQMGGSPNRISPQLAWLKLNQRMGCWNLVEQDLRRSELLLAQTAEWVQPKILGAVRTNVLMIRAELAFHQDRVSEANTLFAEAERELRRWDYVDLTARARLRWIRGLLEHDRVGAALEIVPRALEEAPENVRKAQLLVLSANAWARSEQWERCNDALREFRGRWPEAHDELESWTLHDVLLIRQARVHEEATTLVAAVDSACHRLQERLRRQDAIQEGYLLLRQIEPLRDELHAILAEYPRYGYELELRWRQVPELLRETESAPELGLGSSPLSRCAELVSQALLSSGGQFGDSAAEVLGSDPHLLYRIDKKTLTRWEMVDNAVTAHPVELTENELRKRVNSILRRVGEPSAATGAVGPEIPRRLQKELHELARLVLPTWVFEASHATQRNATPDETQTLWISPDGPLQALPFGILNLSAETYEPLILHFDPIYCATTVRAAEESHLESTPLSALIVTAPELRAGSPAWRSNLPALVGAITEARALHRQSPNSVLLEGRSATKEAVLESWEKASVLYFACHVVRDIDAPYISYLPLAPPTGDSTERQAELEYLDAADIRSATFHESPLVVLSACSSGAPYVVPGAYAPGIGEAFLDAGASTVIHALWSIEDSAAAELMASTMGTWSNGTTSATRALNAARRTMMSEGIFSHPYYWGSVEVMTARP